MVAMFMVAQSSASAYHLGEPFLFLLLSVPCMSGRLISTHQIVYTPLPSYFWLSVQKGGSVPAPYHWALITFSFFPKKVEDNRCDLTQIPTYLSNALVFYSDPYYPLLMLCLMPLLQSLLVCLLSKHLINCDCIVNSHYLFPFIIIELLSCPHLVHSSALIDSQ